MPPVQYQYLTDEYGLARLLCIGRLVYHAYEYYFVDTPNEPVDVAEFAIVLSKRHTFLFCCRIGIAYVFVKSTVFITSQEHTKTYNNLPPS